MSVRDYGDERLSGGALTTCLSIFWNFMENQMMGEAKGELMVRQKLREVMHGFMSGVACGGVISGWLFYVLGTPYPNWHKIACLGIASVTAALLAIAWRPTR
jgi:hypothetical protein